MYGEKAKRFLKKIMILFFWLAVWQLLSAVVDNPFLAASPVETFRSLILDMEKLSFWKTVLMSLFRISAGFGLGLVLGISTAAVNHRFSILEELVSPVINLAKTVPAVSFVVLLLIWQGPSFLSVAVSFLIVFPGIYFSVLEGLRAVGQEKLEMAKIFRLPKKTILFYIYRPALKPFLLGSMKSCLGMAWKAGVAAEVIGLPAYSIGERIYLSKIYLDTAGILAWTAVTVCMSLIFEKAVLKAARIFWETPVVCRAPLGPEALSGGEAPAAAGQGRLRRGRMKQRRTKQRFAGQAEEKGLLPEREASGRSAASIRASGYGLMARNLEKSFSEKSFFEKPFLENAFLADNLSGETHTEKRLFTGISIKLSPGDVRWLTWPSGQGKTTLLRILAGLEEPDRGSVQYGRGRLFLSMLFQEDRLCEEYSALRNVCMVTGDREKAEEILKALLDPSLLEKNCSLLSGGEKRRVALARALAAESDLLFLDEPFAGLDEETAKTAWDVIQKWQRGRALLIASHIFPAGQEPAEGQKVNKNPNKKS